MFVVERIWLLLIVIYLFAETFSVHWRVLLMCPCAGLCPARVLFCTYECVGKRSTRWRVTETAMCFSCSLELTELFARVAAPWCARIPQCRSFIAQGRNASNTFPEDRSTTLKSFAYFPARDCLLWEGLKSFRERKKKKKMMSKCGYNKSI